MGILYPKFGHSLNRHGESLEETLIYIVKQVE